MSPGVRRRVAAARVAYLATSDGLRPSVVPVVFLLRGETVYHAIDAKPKSRPPGGLVRVRNLRRNPNASLLIDHYDDDWKRLWYVLFHGRARLIEKGDEHRRAIVGLRRKYAQYRTTLPLAADSLVIALDIDEVREWVSARRRRGAGEGRPA